MSIKPFVSLPDEPLGQLIRRRRRELGMIQNDLAVATGVNGGDTVGGWERAEHTPSRKYYVAISDVLGIPLAVLETAPSRVVTFPPSGGSPRKYGCGTVAGYHYHNAHKEVICASCRTARAEYRRSRTGKSPRKAAECGTCSGYDAHQRKGETACEPCKRAKRGYARERRARKKTIKEVENGN